MTIKSKICGVSTPEVLDYTINHRCSPDLIGFIVNFPKSKRYVENNNMKEIIVIKNKKCIFVFVLDKQDSNDLN